MTNSEICKIFRDIADLLELKGENPYKARAYRTVVRNIEELAVPVADLVAKDQLGEIPGAGEAIQKKLIELVNTGRLKYYEDLKAEFPPGIVELLALPGVGPKTARVLFNELGVKSVDELEKALKSGKSLPHVGDKMRENILHGIEQAKNGKQRARDRQ